MQQYTQERRRARRSAGERAEAEESAQGRRRARRNAQESKQKRAQKSIRERQIGPHSPSCAILLSLSNSSLRQLQGLQHGCANCLKHSCNGNPWTLKFNDLTRLYRLGSTNCQEAPSENQILKLGRFWRFGTKLLKKTPKIFTRVVPQHDSETRLRKAALSKNAKHSSKSASLVDSYTF